MLFTSLSFSLFLAAAVLVYWLAPHRLRWGLLLAYSLIFYWSIARKLVVFVLFAALFTWGAALILGAVQTREKAAVAAAKAAGADRNARQAVKKKFLPLRRLVLAGFVCCVIGMLLAFKFYNPFAELLAGGGLSLPLLRFAMPLGISFYSLMLYTYFMDVYNGQLAPEKNPLKVCLYTCFFPQIIEGPIARWSQTAPQLFGQHSFSYEQLVLGCQRILWGYFKKLIIADRLNILTGALFTGYEEYQGAYVAVAAVAYTLQLYADFSGGIDIALGAAQLFGIQLPENFNRPFFSKSVSEFWRRWHMTLGGFLRDYLFYPLTFSRPIVWLGKHFKAKNRTWAARWIPTYIAMLAVWFVSGAWHGEGWQYIINGLWNGALITVGESMVEPGKRMWARLGVKEESRGLRLFRVLRTFCFMAIGEVMFRSESVAMMTGMFRGLVSTFNPQVLWDGSLLQLGLSLADFAVVLLALAVVLAASLMARGGSVRRWINARPLPIRWGILLAGVLAVVIFGVYGPAYDPTPFIYFQF